MPTRETTKEERKGIRILTVFAVVMIVVIAYNCYLCYQQGI